MLDDPSKFAGILVYGDDPGLVRDRATAAMRAMVGAENDPFRSSVLLRDEHSRLREEVTSRPLGGGRRAIRVQDATDSLAAVLEPLTATVADALVIVEAGALAARSKLRAMAERHPLWAAIVCGPETGAAVAVEIRRRLEADGLTATQEALDFLAAELAGDTVRRRAELEKLSVFASDIGLIDLDMAVACCAAETEATLVAAVSAAMAGDGGLCDRALATLEREGASGPGLLAVLSIQVQRVLKVRAQMAEGATLEEAARGLYPPIYPRQMAAFGQEVRRWSVTSLRHLGQAVREADVACKRAGSRDFSIAARLLSSVAGRAMSRQ